MLIAPSSDQGFSGMSDDMMLLLPEVLPRECSQTSYLIITAFIAKLLSESCLDVVAIRWLCE